MNSDEILKAELKKAVAECERLREENARLRLKVHEPPVTLRSKSQQFTAHNNKESQASASVTVDSPPKAKVSLFRSIFRGKGRRVSGPVGEKREEWLFSGRHPRMGPRNFTG